jgi:hypothetical protein
LIGSRPPFRTVTTTRAREDASTRAVTADRARHHDAMLSVVVHQRVLSLAIARAARASTGTHSGRASTCE